VNEYLVRVSTYATSVTYRVQAHNKQHATLMAGWNLHAYGNFTDPHLVTTIELKLMRRL
jgi:hypothetical protein